MVYRRRRPMRRALGQVIQSYKKVLTHAPASSAASQIDYDLSSGVDSVAAGQTSGTDANVPTGAVLKYIEIQYSVQNLVSVAATQYLCIQRVHSGQSNINPSAVGGHAQRNQVHWQLLKMCGQDQNNNMTIRFKVPKKFQRVREGDKWVLSVYTDVTHTHACQVIYKFYR